MKKNKLAHTSWNHKYYIVCVSKSRRKVIYGILR